VIILRVLQGVSMLRAVGRFPSFKVSVCNMLIINILGIFCG